MSFKNTIENWQTASDADCLLVKSEVYKLISDWNTLPIGITPTLKDNIYVLYTPVDRIKDENGQDTWKNKPRSVEYDTLTNEFTLSDKEHEAYIPENFLINNIFSTSTLFKHPLTIFFVKYCGIYIASVNVTRDSGGSTSYRFYFEDKNVIDQCVQYCADTYIKEDIVCHTGKEMYSKGLSNVDKLSYIIYYEFDHCKDMNRYEKWQTGDWKKMDKLGIKSDAVHEETWMTGNIMRTGLYHTTTYDAFIKNIIDIINPSDFGCDICAVKSTYGKMYHCLDCITLPKNDTGYNLSFDICETCYSQNKHVEHETTQNHTIYKSTYEPMFEKYIEQMGFQIEAPTVEPISEEPTNDSTVDATIEGPTADAIIEGPTADTTIEEPTNDSIVDITIEE